MPRAKPERVMEQHPSSLHVGSQCATLQHVSVVTNQAGHGALAAKEFIGVSLADRTIGHLTELDPQVPSLPQRKMLAL